MIRRPPTSTLFPYTPRFRSDLVFSDYPDLSDNAFTWIALGSVGRREAVLGSDVDSAVAFLNQTPVADRSEQHTSELQSRQYLVCRLLLEKKQIQQCIRYTHT